MRVALKRAGIVIATVVCAAVLSFGWSGQRGVSLGVTSARAADRSTVGIVRRQHRRSGDELLAAAVAATTSPWIYDDYYCYRVPYTGAHYYRSYPGGYCVGGGYATGLYGRPTLFPRYYGSGVW
jgi:hypothetical protein